MERDGGKSNSPARSLFSVDCPNRHLNAHSLVAPLESEPKKINSAMHLGSYILKSSFRVKANYLGVQNSDGNYPKSYFRVPALSRKMDV